MSKSPILSEFSSRTPQELIAAYRIGKNRISSKVLTLTNEQLDKTFHKGSVTGEWSCRVLLGHLIDAESVFIHRLRRIVGENKPTFATWDENTFIEKELYKTDSPEKMIRLFESTRDWAGDWLSSREEADFELVGIHPQNGEQKFLSILAYATWHVEHHCFFLDQKLSTF